jgi:hypothetical protein
MGFTELGDPFVRSCLVFPDHAIYTMAPSPHFLPQVGPVLDKFKLEGVPIEGQYIAAGYSGHGMPRAFAWFVCSFLPLYHR